MIKLNRGKKTLRYYKPHNKRTELYKPTIFFIGNITIKLKRGKILQDATNTQQKNRMRYKRIILYHRKNANYREETIQLEDLSTPYFAKASAKLLGNLPMCSPNPLYQKQKGLDLTEVEKESPRHLAGDATPMKRYSKNHFPQSHNYENETRK